MGRAELVEDIGQTRDRAAELEARGEVHLSHALRKRPPDELLDRAMAQWDGYHTRTVARQIGPDVIAEDPTLLVYYQNRLLDYATAVACEEDAAAAREIALLGVTG